MWEAAYRDPAVLAYGVACVAFIAFALRLWLGWRGGAKATILLGCVIAAAAWSSLNLAYTLWRLPSLWTLQALADGMRMAGWLLFLLAVLEGLRFVRRFGVALLLLPAAACVLYPAAPAESYVGAAAPSRLPFALLLASAVAGLVLTEQVFRRALEQARWAIKPLCLGLGAGFVFDLYLFADALLFGRLDAGVWAVRGFVHALAIPFIAIATARNKDWTIEIALSRGVLFHSTAFLACGTYLLAVAAAGYYVRYFGGSWGKSLQAAFIFAALLVLAWLFSSGTLRAKLRVFINKHFFSYRYDYRQEWLRFTNLLSSRDPAVGYGERSIRALANLVESPAGALWLREADGTYAQAARWNVPAIQSREQASGSLARFLSRTGWVVDLQEYRRAPERYAGLAIPEGLVATGAAWLVVPVVAHDELLGFIVLAKPRTRLEVDWEVLDLLKTAARQLGSYLAQTVASEALLEARKFESFNKMTAFVVHDLKNLVAQLSLLLTNAERHRHNPRFQEDMLTTVRHVEERMSKLLAQLGSGSRGEETLRAVALPALLERVIAAKRMAGRDIELHCAAAQITTLGYEQRFERVLGHLLQNAIDATREGGDVRVSLATQAEKAVVEIVDSGCGMSEQFVREQLFRPFQTTKASGMGIGAYEAAQYVSQMQGRIEVESRPGAGTRLRLMLPLHDTNEHRAEPLERAA